MNVFGISLTWGHLIIGLIMLAVYDLGWDLLAPDKWSDWWFQRRQIPLRAIIFGVLITLVVIASIDPMLAVWLLAGLVLAIGGYFWWRHNSHSEVKK